MLAVTQKLVLISRKDKENDYAVFLWSNYDKNC